jgi:thymidylate synthase (FAD)
MAEEVSRTTHDVLSNLPTLTLPCLDHGHVRLVDCSPRLVPEDTKTADYAIVQAARVSYGAGTKTLTEDRDLIRYLLRHAHTTPFEMVEFKFHCKMPIFVARQWIRHRTASVNEVSGRYSVVKDEFYMPQVKSICAQSPLNKQGRADEPLNTVAVYDFQEDCAGIAQDAYGAYTRNLGDGIARELARINLPLSLYTEWYWKIDLHNLLHFLALRCDSHAQYEIRVFADAMLELITPIVPLTIEAWNDYHPLRGGMRLSRLEVDALRKMLEQGIGSGYTASQGPGYLEVESSNARERKEWLDKLTTRFGVTVRGEQA